MSLDDRKVKKFWESQAKKVGCVNPEGIANLEEDPQLLDLKVKKEKEKIFSLLHLQKSMKLLDLGSGTGQWSFLFAKHVDSVYGVEYSKGMYEIAIKRKEQLGVKNVNFINEKAQKFKSNELYDVIFISGLIIYLNDGDFNLLLNNIENCSHLDTIILLRDGTAINRRHEIKNQYSKNLKSYYSATYRTSDMYIDSFRKQGFQLIKDEDIFEKESPLNKWEETRLRVYLFKYGGRNV
ncbi:MAG: class I SAM-dependent methyltransferase [Bacteroidales bacterium]|nr:class I SAM-dependent methyltransferase [Bacteroidales bacterium]